MPSPLDRRSRRRGGNPQIRPYRWSFTAMIGMAMLAFLVAATAGVPPWPVTVALVAGWLVLFVVACRWFVRHPRRILALPIGGFVVWLLVIGIGVRQGGWS